MQAQKLLENIGLSGKIVITSDKKLYIENHKGMYKYNDNEVWLGYENGGLKIMGNDLHLREISSDFVEILGNVEHISFNKKEW